MELKRTVVCDNIDCPDFGIHRIWNLPYLGSDLFAAQTPTCRCGWVVRELGKREVQSGAHT